MAKKPNDRLKKTGKDTGKPQILKVSGIKIPDKEIQVMTGDEKPPKEVSGGQTCSCHSVCTCVPVTECSCHQVCTCDSVCSGNDCTCHPFEACSSHSCSPHSGCAGNCCVGNTSCSSCSSCAYWYPN